LWAIFFDPLLQELSDSKLGVKWPNSNDDSKKLVASAFADDLLMIASSRAEAQRLLDICGDFAERKGLQFHPGKSEYMITGKCGLNDKWGQDLQLHGQTVAETDRLKLLGVYVNQRIGDLKVPYTIEVKSGKVGDRMPETRLDENVDGEDFEQRREGTELQDEEFTVGPNLFRISGTRYDVNKQRTVCDIEWDAATNDNKGSKSTITWTEAWRHVHGADAMRPWTMHIDYSRGKANRAWQSLRNTCHLAKSTGLDPNSAVHLMKVLCLPCLFWGSELWSADRVSVTKLEKFHKQMLCTIMTGTSYRGRYDRLRFELGQLTLQDQLDLRQLLFAQRLNTMDPRRGAHTLFREEWEKKPKGEDQYRDTMSYVGRRTEPREDAFSHQIQVAARRVDAMAILEGFGVRSLNEQSESFQVGGRRLAGNNDAERVMPEQRPGRSKKAKRRRTFSGVGLAGNGAAAQQVPESEQGYDQPYDGKLVNTLRASWKGRLHAHCHDVSNDAARKNLMRIHAKMEADRRKRSSRRNGCRYAPLTLAQVTKARVTI